MHSLRTPCKFTRRSLLELLGGLLTFVKCNTPPSNARDAYRWLNKYGWFTHTPRARARERREAYKNLMARGRERSSLSLQGKSMLSFSGFSRLGQITSGDCRPSRLAIRKIPGSLSENIT